MKPKNCNECKYHNNCNSYYGGLGCRYKITPLLVTLAIVLIMGTMVVGAAEAPELLVIDAEDIGIKEIEDNIIETESEIVDDPVQTEPEKEEVETPDSDDVDVDTPTYTPPHTHTYVYSVYWDDGYVYEEWCDGCGEGTETPITDEEFNNMGINTDEEYSYD
jgi:hypothetical protein